MIAAAAFLLTIGGTAVANSLAVETVWVYANGDIATEPNCDLDPRPICARQYLKLPNGQPDFNSPMLAEKRGNRL